MEDYIEGFPSIASIEAGYDAVTTKSCLVSGLTPDQLTSHTLHVDFGHLRLGEYRSRRIYLSNRRLGRGRVRLRFQRHDVRPGQGEAVDDQEEDLSRLCGQIHEYIQAMEEEEHPLSDHPNPYHNNKKGMLSLSNQAEIGFKSMEGQKQIRRHQLDGLVGQLLRARGPSGGPVRFLAWPDHIDLDGGGSGAYIDLYCLADLPGQYDDLLDCLIIGSSSSSSSGCNHHHHHQQQQQQQQRDYVQVQVQVQISGSPIRYPPDLRLGPVLTRSGTNTKRFSLYNRSTADLLLQWSIRGDHPSDQPIRLSTDIQQDGALQLHLRPNQGDPVECLSIDPSSCIIPARSYRSVSVHYKASDQVESVLAYLHAELLIRVGDQWRPGPVQPYRDPVCVRLHAASILPHLTPPKKSPIVLESDQRRSVTKSITLTNQLPIALLFNVKSSNSDLFAISRMDTALRSASRMIHVNPGQDIRLAICFKPSGDSCESQQASLCIRYSNETIQELQLVGRVVLPELQLSMSDWDFGDVYVNSDSIRKDITMTIQSSTSSFTWRIIHVRRPVSNSTWKALNPAVLRTFSNAEFDSESEALDDASAFHFTETTGQIRSDDRRKTISVIFRPTQRRRILSIFEIDCGSSTGPCRIRLSGNGTFNEANDMQSIRHYVKR